MQVIRSAMNIAFWLLVFLCLFGIVGSMDYHDAMMMENAQQQSGLRGCPKSDFRSPTQTHRCALSDVLGINSSAPCRVLTH
jgi:hypothetical protein